MDNRKIPNSIFGILGLRLDYSFSKAYFTEKFERLKLDDHEYRNFELGSEEELLRFRESVIYNDLSRTTNGKAEIVRGLNVTIPYKETVMQLLDELSPEAKAIGAVNTIAIENNIWTGHNTDCYGFAKSLEPHLPIKGNALILGTGGASKAIAYTLEALQIPYLYVSRNPTGDYEIPYDKIDKDLLKDIGLIVNTTPLGTHPNVDEAPNLPYEHLNKGTVLHDLTYNPANTLFMKKGSAYDATGLNGYQMLVHQAERAWEIWNE